MLKKGHRAPPFAVHPPRSKVAAISTITNMAAALSEEAISHDHTKKMAPLGAERLERLPARYLTRS